MIKHLPIELPSHEVMARFACEDPQGFVKWRHEVIEHHINQAPERIRDHLRKLQSRIDRIRQFSPSPLDALVEIHMLMCESCIQIDKTLKLLVRQISDSCATEIDGVRVEPSSARSASILPFQPRSPVRESSHEMPAVNAPELHPS